VEDENEDEEDEGLVEEVDAELVDEAGNTFNNWTALA
jgi:hypothetical protein